MLKNRLKMAILSHFGENLLRLVFKRDAFLSVISVFFCFGLKGDYLLWPTKKNSLKSW